MTASGTRRTLTLAGAGLIAVGVLAAGGVAQAGRASVARGAAAIGPAGIGAGQWPVAGQNLFDTHYQADEHAISAGNASQLVKKWVLTTAGDVTATPTVAGGVVYVPDMGGKLWAVNAATGKAIWSQPIATYTGITGDVSRTSPAIVGDKLIGGDGWIGNSLTAGAHVFAVNRKTGAKRWSVSVDSNPASIITGSPAVYNGVAYVGISSKEEGLASQPGYKCCTFRGAIVALSVATGKILWKAYTVPSNNHGGDSNKPGYYSGGAVWGSSPAVDPAGGRLYIATGNNYTVPSGVCTKPNQTGCKIPIKSDEFDAMLALSLSNGSVVWDDRTLDGDVSSGACKTCGPDYDFGSAPNLFTTINPATHATEQLLGTGQKSGIYWAVNAATGKVVWQTKAGPGGPDGGIEWGSATDGNRVYVAESDSSGTAYKLGGTGPFAGQTATGGSWGALDAATGKILWQTPDPQKVRDPGYVTAANGVIYAGSTASTGTNMYALNASTGKILWSFASGADVQSGPAVVGGTVFWGSGYRTDPNDDLYAFGL